ncbi:MAG: dTDP-4-dehydrorhamnose 3,5-epimerase [Candidatus Neomarinimicrobiota bacterium]|nr:MAG: dTDP-4-dehydrorhamnose 3,5-epimerase [Candidatus Neomarinimicrobiota bacterium]
MKFVPTAIPEVIRIQPVIHRDERGYFLESFQRHQFASAGLPDTFVQDNQVLSTRNVLRGLHFQRQFPQGKLVTCPVGKVWDVAVDLRRHSPTFRRWVGVELSEDNLELLYVPPGFAHGYVVLSATALFQYKCTEFYHPEDEGGVRWNDPTLRIPWPVTDPVVSAKDEALPTLDPDTDGPFAYGDIYD